MIYSLAARAYLMHVDYKVDLSACMDWVLRKFRPGLRSYYRRWLIYLLVMDVERAGIRCSLLKSSWKS